MNILIEARTLLETAGYKTVAVDAAAGRFYFEDSSILGVAAHHETVDILLRDWESLQDEFLRRYAGQLRASPAKAWNIYTIHLTEEPVSISQSSRLFAVEEDFRGTRKIARGGVTNKESLRTALLPLLPIQKQVSLAQSDLDRRLSERLASLHPALGHINNLSPQKLAARLMEPL